jgi:hypothetical protein
VRAAAALRPRLLLPLLQGKEAPRVISAPQDPMSYPLIVSGIPVYVSHTVRYSAYELSTGASDTPARRRLPLIDCIGAGEASGGKRTRAEAHATGEPAGRGRHAGDAEREAEAVVGRGAELRRVVAEAQPEAARAGTRAVLLTSPTFGSRKDLFDLRGSTGR